jgi:pimeloyl-ACP methyl ester carboxylesterase
VRNEWAVSNKVFTMLHYQRRGKGSTIILQHGFLGGGGYWLPQLAAFGAEFDVIAPDLPGFASSAGEPVCESIEGLGDALVALLDTLGIERFSLLGHSMGGMMALQLALAHPGRIEKLVLYGTAASGDLPKRFETLEESIARLEAEGVDASARRISATWFVDGEAAPYYRLCCEAGRGASLEAAVTALAGVGQWDVRARLGELQLPTLVICGDRDRATAPEQAYELWNGIAGSHLCIVPGCAHAVHLEKPEIFNQIVRDFLVCSVASTT